MLIDWFTVGAQVVNFLILVVLLKKFLYGPITQAMAAREAKVKAQLTEAEAQRQAAAAEEAAIHQRLQELEETRQALADRVKAEVDDQKQALLEAARQELEQYRQGRLQALEREQTAWAQSLQERVGAQIFAVARLILRQLADTSLEQQVVEVFLKHLGELSPEDHQAFQESLPESAGDAVVASAFELGEADRTRIRAAVQARFGPDLTLRFDTDPGVILGIELKTRGRKLSWTTASFMHRLEARLGEALTSSPPGTPHDD